MKEGGITEGNRVRPAAVAGQFYPADPKELRGTVEAFLSAAASAKVFPPKCLIAPHAGYPYSGPIAAAAYAQLVGADFITRVVLIGPSHFVHFRGIAGSSASQFQTPLGPVPVDEQAYAKVKDLPQFVISDKAHSREHSLEVHLPFLQVLLPRFSIVPLVVGEATPEEVAEVLDRLWGQNETLVVASTDLSHYHDAETARRLDRATADAIVQMRPEAISEDRACGRLAVSGLLRIAAARQLRTRELDLRNSGDTAGPRHQVVGYGAFALEPV